MDMGLMQCAIGDGKGKTTALIGQLVRAQGQGFKCVCFQFLKTQPSGECAALEQLGIPVERAQTDNTKFVFEMNAAERVRISWRSGRYIPARCALCAPVNTMWWGWMKSSIWWNWARWTSKR